MKSSMDAFFLSFEDQKPLVGLDLAPQRHRPLQEPPSLRLAIFLDHLLDPRALFCRMGRLDGFHSISVPWTDTGELSPIAQPGSVGGAILDRSGFPGRRYRAAAPRAR